MGSKEVTLGTLYMPMGGRRSPFSRTMGVSASPVREVKALNWVLEKKEKIDLDYSGNMKSEHPKFGNI